MVCATFGALWWVLPFGGTRGPALRFVPRLVRCGGCCLSAGREAPPYGLCRVDALWWGLPFGGTRGPALRFVPQ